MLKFCDRQLEEQKAAAKSDGNFHVTLHSNNGFSWGKKYLIDWLLLITMLGTEHVQPYLCTTAQPSAHNKTGAPMNWSGNRKGFPAMPWRHIMSSAELIIIIYDRWNSVHSFVSAVMRRIVTMCLVIICNHITHRHLKPGSMRGKAVRK